MMKSNISDLIETGEVSSLKKIFSGDYSTKRQKKKSNKKKSSFSKPRWPAKK